ncbi:MAG TPA: transketolase C-terminal domain-containing protein [Sulfuricurvum sp.]|nr:MAG: ferredoxin oxidoreductase [Campylobacterales bacterium 16-40-21]OZA03977.1 MAG: ferredoxin oxidoreductase [Sulfuricurvum sp. 17-40-25]HQS65978.1 transketolase C-terminal domain-containing protein [Sulfuricurvum sp.]HQT35782.1 transketolase C-terminal domain-containing protein [Sulfuricurvum sp.]
MSKRSDMTETKNWSGQTLVTADHMLFEAPRSKHFMTGSEVLKEAVKRCTVDASVSYPITPQSEAAHLIGELWAEGYVGVYFRGENEFGVMSEVAGCAMAGARTITTTSGPGTLRAMENFAQWSGTRIPCQLILMARGINSPLTIQPDNLEVSYMLETGCQIWYAENVQELFDMSIAAFVVAEKPDVHVPIITVVDGFFVSHTRESVMLPEDDIALFPYDPNRAPLPAIDSETPPGRFLRDPFVMKSNYISYATHASWQWEIRSAVERSVPYARHYLKGLVHVTGDADAEIAFVACGTASYQAKEAHRELTKLGIKTKVIKLRTIRPFPEAELLEALKGVKTIFVPEFNVVGWLEKEVKKCLYGKCDANVVGGPRVAGGMSMPAEAILREVMEKINSGKGA